MIRRTMCALSGIAHLVFMASLSANPSEAADCAVTSVGLTPIHELGSSLYLGQFQGGLYPGGSNDVPAVHASVGRTRSAQIVPLDTLGAADPDGKYVFLSIGMSNTTQEFCSANAQLPCDPWTFMGRAATHPDVDTTHLAIVNGALGGQTAASWDSPTDFNYDRVRDTQLIPSGLSELQVQAVWVKVANPFPTQSLPNAGSDARNLLGHMGDIARALRQRYPNVKIVLFSSRIYAGYASTTLNPEPYAYESAFSVKRLIEAQIDQMDGGGIDPVAGDLSYDATAPWIAWGPYLWADGLTTRDDGLVWECADFETDGTHPSQSGESKVGALLLDFMLDSQFTATWFRSEAANPVPASSPPTRFLLVLAMLVIAGMALRQRASPTGMPQRGA